PGPVAQRVFKTRTVVQPTARSVRLRRRSVAASGAEVQALLAHYVVKVVKAVPGRLGEGIGIRKRLRALLDQRLGMLGKELLGVVGACADVDDPEPPGLIVEPRSVGDQALEGTVADLVRDEVVVRRRVIGDREFLDVGNCHNASLPRFPRSYEAGRWESRAPNCRLRSGRGGHSDVS